MEPESKDTQVVVDGQVFNIAVTQKEDGQFQGALKEHPEVTATGDTESTVIGSIVDAVASGAVDLVCAAASAVLDVISDA